MRMITGDECGLLKDIIPDVNCSSIDSNRISSSMQQSSSIIHISHGSSSLSQQQGLSMKRSQGVVGLAFCPQPPNALLSFCALRLDGTIERWEGRLTSGKGEDLKPSSDSSSIHYVKTHFWNPITLKRKNLPEGAASLESVERPIGICSSQRYQNPSTANTDCTIACCTSMGNVSVFCLSPTTTTTLNGLSTYEPYGKLSDTPTITYTKGHFANNDLATAMAMDYDGARLAIGGRERETVIMDVTTGTVIWKAKNLPPNPQTLLQQPIWTTTMTFLSPTDTTSISDSTNLLATGTAYKQVRIYDVRENSVVRRPVMYTPEFDSDKLNLFHHRLTSVCQVNSNSIVVGDAAGYIHTLDLRKIHANNAQGRCMAASIGRFSGPAGSVRQIVKHEDLPIIACVGLDRMLRTYDTVKRKSLDCIYLRQRLNCMLMCSDGRLKSSSTMGTTEDEDDEHLPFAENESYGEEDEVQEYICSDDQDDDSSNEDTMDDAKNEDCDDDDNGGDQNNEDQWTDYSSDDSSSAEEEEEFSDSDTEEVKEDKKKGKASLRRPASLGTSSKRKRL